MKKTETVITTTVVEVTEVRFGDVFQFTKQAGCRRPGEMLVIQENSTDVECTYISCLDKNGEGSNFTSLYHLTEEMNKGNLVFLGNIDGKEE